MLHSKHFNSPCDRRKATNNDCECGKKLFDASTTSINVAHFLRVKKLYILSQQKIRLRRLFSPSGYVSLHRKCAAALPYARIIGEILPRPSLCLPWNRCNHANVSGGYDMASISGTS
mmetsp:Transcript_9376/g.10873  ORF Transcript_9376/g.10873 Transcript_9376/m.10873 type:complete len:117 (-) Transcript_9376:480-830(-)